jgi:serine/threonine protein kinase/dipeptidyl aminopeptidase/acylaminoacyl peptidase
MTTGPDRWATVERLYHAALARPADRRAAFLAEACAGDEELWREVESLLAQGVSAEAALTRGAAVAAAGLVSDLGGSMLTGRRLGGYQVLAPLGAGGMGEVYRARDTRLGRDVAIKILPRAFTADAGRLARFEREARVLASLNHPHIGAIHGIEDAPMDTGSPVRALILELVEGETLAERIKRSGFKGLPVKEALDIARQVADALDAAHEKGIVHRDLKPANIKITPQGIVKVLDFGLAKLEAASDGAEGITEAPTITVNDTREGWIVGTAAYMSPEQARGQAVDKRTDIWAFGCVLYEMLTGRAAFARATVSDTIAAVLEHELDWTIADAMPAAIQRVVRRCLNKDPKRRFRDIGDVQTEFEEMGAESPAHDGSVVRDARSRRGVLTFAVAVLIAAAGLLVGNTAFRSPPANSAASRLSRVTWDAAFSTEPAISPDGTLIVYASDRGGAGQQLDLWLQRASGGQPIRLTDDPADDREPAFSPDGDLIAFRSTRNGGGVFVMPALGGDARLVGPGGRTPRFSADASQIAYWTGPWLGGPRTPGAAIFTVSSTGGQPVRLSEGFATALSPVWSPDGRKILFFGSKATSETRNAGFDWWIVSLDTRDVIATGAYALLNASKLYGTTVNNSIAPTPDALPSAWTRDGVLFSARFEHSINLWRLKVSEETGKAVEQSLERLTDGAGSDVLPSVDGNGRITFGVEGFTRDSLVLPLDSNAGKPLGPIQRHSADSALVDGRSSLDDQGRILAYPRIRVTESEIWLKDLMTGRERHLVTTPLSQLNPRISHDASRVAYTVPDGDSASGYVITTTGGAATKICDGCNLQGWLSDNQRILALNLGTAASGAVNPGAVNLGGGPGRVRLLDTMSAKAADVLVDPNSGIGRVDVSPDERWIAFQSRNRLWLAPFDARTSPPESSWISILEVARGSAERACGWSPDGRLLYLLLERDGFRDLWAQRIDQGRPVGEPFVVQHLHDPRRRWGSTPYGTGIVKGAFVFNQTELVGSIWLRQPPAPLR